ncbi:MAG: hypothetical protein GXY83_08990 [Rhodopirellula sp.]|nr:hypothetical protein [Rhodopirellula sp.]
MTETLHWSQDRYWTEALERLYALREQGVTHLTVNLAAISEIAFQDDVAYKLMEAMVSVHEHEGWEGYRGAPRLMLALLVRLEELSNSRDGREGPQP